MVTREATRLKTWIHLDKHFTITNKKENPMDVLGQLANAESLRRKQDMEFRRHAEKFEKKTRKERQDRDMFLSESHAIPTPLDWYAAWLYVWLRQGGEITHPRDANMQGRRYWTPRLADQIIPSGHGSLSINILAIESLTPGYAPALRENYGHNNILWLDLTGNGEAQTSNPFVVESFLDVEDLICDREERLLEDVRKSVRLEQ
jgi:hypothetical protein